MSTAREDDDFPELLTARGIPFVSALRGDGKSLSSVGDDRLGGYLATRHLLDLGHRRIGVIAGASYASSSIGRVQGYRQALEEAGISICLDYIIPSTFGIDAGTDATQRLMNLHERPTAIFAANDNTAIGALSGLSRMGVSVPGDISVVIYYDIPTWATFQHR